MRAMLSRMSQREPDAPTQIRQRDRQIMRTTRRLYGTLESLVEMLRFRYRSGEGADQIEMHLEILEDAKTPTMVRAALAEILSAPDDAIRPPRLAALVDMSLRALFAATADGGDIAGAMVVIADACRSMVDPYDAASQRLSRFPSGVYLIAPAGYTTQAQTMSVASLASPETSTSVSRSVVGKLRRSEAPQGMIATPES